MSRPVSRALRVALPTAVFLSGGGLLALEIAASRVLAPYFGSSIYVWGALIGIILTGLAVGYWAGGALADRLPHPWLLSAVLTLGGLLVLLVPVIDNPLQEAIARWNPGPRADPLLAAAALFGPASVILAMATPIAVRLSTQLLERVGTASGRLFAISTAGSICGVFATAFFLIPRLGLERLLALDALVILVGAVLVAAAERMVWPLAAALVAVALAAGAATLSTTATLTGAAPNYTPAYVLHGHLTGKRPDLAAEGLKAVYQRDSQYHRITVAENADSRFLRFDSSFQSGMFRAQPFLLRFAYTNYMDLGLAYDPSARQTLMIGLGGGSTQKQLWRAFPDLTVTTVELDPAVRDVAYRFFDFPKDPRLPVVVADGRRYLDLNQQSWDVIMIDAFYADSVPFHLTTREFLTLVASRLNSGGVVVANVIGSLEGPRSKLLRSFVRTYSSVFPMVELYPVRVPGEDCRQAFCNVILVAGNGPRLEAPALLANWRQALGGRKSPVAMAGIVASRYGHPLPLGDVPTLTDDYAPTDSLLPLYDQR
jgi:spermidine synthase